MVKKIFRLKIRKNTLSLEGNLDEIARRTNFFSSFLTELLGIQEDTKAVLTLDSPSYSEKYLLKMGSEIIGKSAFDYKPPILFIRGYEKLESKSIQKSIQLCSAMVAELFFGSGYSFEARFFKKDELIFTLSFCEGYMLLEAGKGYFILEVIFKKAKSFGIKVE